MEVCVGLNVGVGVGEIGVDGGIRVGVLAGVGVPVDVNVADGKGVSSVRVGSRVERQATNTTHTMIRLQAIDHLFTQFLLSPGGTT